MEKVITVYQGEKAKNYERWMEALCDRKEEIAFQQMNELEKEFEKRKNLNKEK